MKALMLNAVNLIFGGQPFEQEITFENTRRKSTAIRIPENKPVVNISDRHNKGDMASYVIISLMFFSFLTIFMEFPSLHPGYTYVQRNGKWVEIVKPIFHIPFNFKGLHTNTRIKTE